MVLSVQDRVASIQAGGWGAIAVGIVATLCEWVNDLIPHLQRLQMSGLEFSWMQSLGSVLFAAVSGFLFGVTYRYIRRTDPNPHLQTGAIAAFGLTRGLAQLDMGLLLHGQIEWVLLMLGESMLMIAIAAISLEWALTNGWIQQVQ